MKELNKTMYEIPETLLVELTTEGIICGSGEVNGYGDGIVI
jgi:hypothetical protein